MFHSAMTPNFSHSHLRAWTRQCYALQMRVFFFFVSARIVTVPGSSSRELSLTHCEAADVVVHFADTQDKFSLPWLEGRVDVVVVGSRLGQGAEGIGLSIARHSWRRQQQLFVLLKVDDGVPRQVVFLREVRRFLRHSDDILRSSNLLWLL
ncbi:hypothetical protein TraAM80_05617 [Trypanosoma rangeli]|uniref:Uncharacterized protein n=1 Tax=Trypanosoma rangeli TaxID=5698 RepID=A0A422NE00_TRYRA|nr:uncharacterized protein TraAM80_05617 [Trypanosoma rangeli]RNF03559.1 hypothetical protein TraAM80_05617 [Trypanosoma rangeli]|eukprot:RNF03559.1 hypothetical protein TraAM80_05617 [Trypanosoma rangeli]